MMNKVNARFWSLTGMICAAAAMRILPHPLNFAPVTAIALFGGAHFRQKHLAFFLPLSVMFLSDFALLWLHGYRFDGSTPAVYASFAAITWIGTRLSERRQPIPVLGTVLASSALFFIVTNFSVWAFGSLYPKTAVGLMECYVAAIPFFDRTLMGDLFYSAVLFGSFAWAEKRFPALILSGERATR